MTNPTSPPDGREFRALTAGLELRSAEGSATRTAAGYAVVYNSKADLYGCWTETIAPGAFDKSIQERDVIAIRSHDATRIVGRKGAGTLTLRSDDRGIAFENPLPDTTDGRDLAVMIDRGDIAGMSYGFIAKRQEWDDTVEPPHRTILEGDLFEITYTPLPVYKDSEVALRSLEHARAERRGHDRAGGSARIAARRARQAQVERGIY